MKDHLSTPDRDSKSALQESAFEGISIGKSSAPPAFSLDASPIQKVSAEAEQAPAIPQKTQAVKPDNSTTQKQEAIQPSTSNEKPKYYVMDPKAYLRNDKGEKVDGNKTIPKLSEVFIEKELTVGKMKLAYVKSFDGATDYGYTSKSNLTSATWNPKDHETEYKGVSDVYNEQMQAVDPTKTRADLIKSGTGVKALADKYYPNSTDPEKLASDFKTKIEKMITGFSTHGITAKKTAGLRHPLRSTIFHYAILVAKSNSTEETFKEANIVSTKYGIPIDWIHNGVDGKIDLALSRKKAEEVKTEFSISKDAAMGLDDFGGNISNHNNGRAVDLNLTFSFTEPKEIKIGEKVYSVDPSKNNGSDIADIENDGLSLFGKEQYGVTRAIDTDAIHWSVSGR